MGGWSRQSWRWYRPYSNHYPIFPGQEISIPLGYGQGCHCGRLIRVPHSYRKPDEF